MSNINNRRTFLGAALALLACSNSAFATISCQNDEPPQTEWNVKKFGAIGDGINDDYDVIQKLIDHVSSCGGGIIFFPLGKYRLSHPLVIKNPGIALVGIGSGSVLLRLGKIDKLPSIKILAPGTHSTTDQYGVDAIIILQAPAQAYLYGISIKSLLLQAIDCQPMFGIYAPRWSHGIISDVGIANCDVGYLTYNAWMCKFSRVTVTNVNRGFVIADDGSGQGAGTSQSFDDCWVNSANQVAWDIYGLKYSSFVACGADHVGLQSSNGVAYKFKACESLELTACGAEDIIGTVLSASRCVMHISGLNAGFAIRPAASKTPTGLIAVSDNSTVIIDSSVLKSDISGCNAVTADGTSLVYLRGNTFKGMIAPVSNARIKIDG